MVQVLLAEGLIDRDYIREQTDLPFLVRTDNGRFLRESDFVAGETARDNLFYVWDEKTGKAVPGAGHRRSATAAGLARAGDPGRNAGPWRPQARARRQLEGKNRSRAGSRSPRSSSWCKRRAAGLHAGKGLGDLRRPPGQHPAGGPDLRPGEAGDDFRRLPDLQMAAG